MSTNDRDLESFQIAEKRQGAKSAKDAKEKLWRSEPPQSLDVLARRVIGAALEVHTVLGPGFLEHVYEEAMCIELASRGIAFERQLVLPVEYKGIVIAESRLDLLVEENLVLELKAVDELKPIHHSQLLSYLRSGEFQLGLLINFNVAHLRDAIKRVVWTG